ncbi:hypothetical protein PanWU01x14_362280 [Parasponia andersonii]|uniref:Uncharacterized protein n=1 Tax=Parasponia andersonii TaxID=3476 RepID=A0A2P5A717_PARAD|nr:hypothetical protein PanWU01x14_362280 [Parasponia andersonii]
MEAIDKVAIGKPRIQYTPPESCRGLGVRKMNDVNRVFLARWGWLLITSNKSFMGIHCESKVSKEHRFPKGAAENL